MNAARSTGKPLLREAATLILVARNKKIQYHFDYRILLLERVARSTFMPSTYVFPGGVIEQADFSNDWMDLFKESFVKFGRDFSSLVNIPGVRPPALKKSSTAMPSEVAFRICAIRETFEESGVLLLKSHSQNKHSNLSTNDIHSWRQEIHSDPSKFVAMCREFDCVPDVWSLSEWSNWLTPAHLKTRFDTLFFICFVDEEPTVHLDEQEVAQSKWLAPAEAVVKHVTGQLKLGMPQVYEMLRFCRFTKRGDLKSFQERRAGEGCEQWLTITVKCSDGKLSVLPVDDLYEALRGRIVQEVSASDTGQIAMIEYPESVAEMNSKAKNLHRVLWRPISLLCNVKLQCGQCSPVTDIQTIMNLVQQTQSNL